MQRIHHHDGHQSNENEMRRLLIISLICLLFSTCTKPGKDKDCLVSLSFSSTQTPATATLADGIVSYIVCSGPNLCYRFYRFSVTTGGQPNRFTVQAIGTVPCVETVCAQAIYYHSDTLRIPVTTTGTYYLSYARNEQVYRTDTIQVY